MNTSAAAAVVTEWVRVYAGLIADNREQLTDLDAAIGDADHGENMYRGLTAAVAALDGLDGGSPRIGAGDVLKKVGMTLVSTVGGASGPLYGTFFLRMAASLGDVETVTADQFAAALGAGLEGVVQRGKAEPGDKTMYDALAPGIDALKKALGEQRPAPQALAAARAAAEAGRDATTPMVARKGRASYLGERSVGHQDPGATSAALLFAAATRAGF